MSFPSVLLNPSTIIFFTLLCYTHISCGHMDCFCSFGNAIDAASSDHNSDAQQFVKALSRIPYAHYKFNDVRAAYNPIPAPLQQDHHTRRHNRDVHDFSPSYIEENRFITRVEYLRFGSC